MQSYVWDDSNKQKQTAGTDLIKVIGSPPLELM